MAQPDVIALQLDATLSAERPMRICSLLPSATEIVFALGLGDQLVAVTHECDYPPEASGVRVITESLIDHPRGAV